MHYKNGREAKNGDKVVAIQSCPQADGQTGNVGATMVGILYDAKPGQDYCNGKLAPINPNDPIANLAECLHLDDVLAAISKAPELQKPAAEAAPAPPADPKPTSPG